MDIYFAATEQESFQWVGNPGLTTNAVSINAARSRCGITLTSHTTESIIANHAPVTEAWIHIVLGSAFDGNSNDTFLTIAGPTSDLFRIKFLVAIPSLEYWDGAAWQVVSTSAPMAALSTIDIRIVMDDVAGALEWFVNNNRIGSAYTGDTIFTADTTFIKETFRYPDYDGTFLDKLALSEIMVTSGRAKYLQTLGIDGDGADTQFTGGFADINENGVDDADVIGSSLAADVSTFTKEALPALGQFEEIVGVVTAARIRNDGIAPVDAQFVTRSGGAAYSFTANIPGMNVGFDPYQNIMMVDPNTGLAWVFADLNAAQVGLKSI